MQSIEAVCHCICMASKVNKMPSGKLLLKYYFTNLSLLQRVEISFSYLHKFTTTLGDYLQKFDIYKSLLNIGQVRLN